MDKISILNVDVSTMNEKDKLEVVDIYKGKYNLFVFYSNEGKSGIQVIYDDYTFEGILESIFKTVSPYLNGLYILYLNHFNKDTFVEALSSKFEIIEDSNLEDLERTLRPLTQETPS